MQGFVFKGRGEEEELTHIKYTLITYHVENRRWPFNRQEADSKEIQENKHLY